MYRTQFRRTLGLVLTCLLLSEISYGQEISHVQEATFLLRALSLDRNLGQRSGSTISIAVVHAGPAGAEESDLIAKAFEDAGQSGVLGRSLTVQVVIFESVEALIGRVDTEGINVIYIHSSIEPALSAILQVTRGKRIPSITASRTFVESGVSLGVYSFAGMPKVTINVRAAQTEGLDFPAQLLAISTVVR